MAGLSETLILSPHESESLTYSALVALEKQLAGSKSICVEAGVPESTRAAVSQVESGWECSADDCGDECGDSALFASSTDFRVLVVQPRTLQRFLLQLNPTAKSQTAFALVRTENLRKTGTILRTFLSSRELLDYFIERPLKQWRMDLFDRSGVYLANGEAARPLGYKIGSSGVVHLAGVNPLGGELLQRCREKAGELPSSAERKREIEALRDRAILALNGYWERPLASFLDTVTKETNNIKDAAASLLYDIGNYSSLLHATSEKQASQRELIAGFARDLPASISRAAEEVDKIAANAVTIRERLTQLLNVQRKVGFELQAEGRQSDMRMIVSVKRKKQYPIPCELVVVARGAPDKVFALEQANEGQQVDVGSFGEFPDAVIQAYVRSPQSGEALSAAIVFDVRSRGPLSIPRPASQAPECALYRIVGNIEDVEMEVRASAGEAGLSAFRSVAAAWENFDGQRALDFIEICKAEATRGVAVMKARLAEAGFNVR